MSIKTTRRTFMKQAAAASAMGPFILSRKARGQRSNGKLRHASIGVGGQMGDRDLIRLAEHEDIEIVALCDVDDNFLNEAAEGFPEARLYNDWRVLLEEEADNIDSINAAVPNHMHAPISITAMRLGKHVYCQKPLTHSMHEARVMAEEAGRRPDQITQMGVQTHNHPAYRNFSAMLQAGVFGKIKEVHSWDLVRWHYTGDFSDPPTERQPETGIDPPDYLHWDLYLGVAPERPFNEELYHIRMWRRWHDFGGGARGDMAGHMLDVPFHALELTQPKWIMSYKSPPYEDTFSPDNMCVHRFPETPYTDGDIDYYWHDTCEIDTTDWPVDNDDLPGNGSMLICDKGFILLPHVDDPQFFPEEEFEGAVQEYVDSEGRMEGVNHYHEFVDACLGRTETSTPFCYSGNMTETVLIGNIANRFPEERLEWDPVAFEFPNKPEANQYLSRPYRDGWHIRGLG